MNVLFAGHQERGVACLRALLASDHTIVGVLAHAPAGQAPRASVADEARRHGLLLFQPADVNDLETIRSLQGLAPDVTVLAGYSPIVKRPFIELAPRGCINLHGGKLPQYRGSSPMNWALINGESTFSLSIIRVNERVDAGPVLLDRNFPIGTDDTIADLQAIASRVFPEMLLEVLQQIERGTVRERPQDEQEAGYYPLRFPEDGVIFWDACTALQIHNRIRALTDPYPGAFTFHRGRCIKLLRSRLAKRAYHGEPGRVYLKKGQGLLVCASDRCLWIERAVFEDTGTDAIEAIGRYEQMATLRGLAMASLLDLGPR